MAREGGSVTPEFAAGTHHSKLLVLTSTYPRWRNDHEPGFVHELSRRLSGEFDVVVLCPHATGAAVREKLDGVDVRRYRYAPAGLETLVHNGGIVGNLARAKWKWLLVPGFFMAQAIAIHICIRRDRPAVIHGHWLIPQGLLLAVLSVLIPRFPPFLLTSHGADLFALRGRVADRVRQWVISRAAAVTVVSAAMRQMLLGTGVEASKVSVQSMGVDLLDRFTPANVPRSADEILFVGRLVEKKGLRYLIDAMPAIVATRPSTFLTIAGFGPEEAALRAQVAQLGLDDRVHFVGAVRQDALPAMYRRAAVFVAPFVEASSGDQEGLGLVVIEAAGCNCPVVMSRLPATETLLAASPDFVAVPPGDSAALAAAIALTLQGATASPRESVMHYDWTARAAAYGELLSELARRRTAR